MNGIRRITCVCGKVIEGKDDAARSVAAAPAPAPEEMPATGEPSAEREEIAPEELPPDVKI